MLAESEDLLAWLDKRPAEVLVLEPFGLELRGRGERVQRRSFERELLELQTEWSAREQLPYHSETARSGR